MFNLKSRVAVVTGGSGVLGRVMARGLAAAGARVAVLARDPERVAAAVAAVTAAGGEALGVSADVLDQWGRVDILVNGAGGNVAGATLPPGGDVFGLPRTAFQQVFDLNLTGTLLPTQVFGEAMARAGSGVVVNLSSMAAGRAITRIVGYSAAKAAVDNFTRWMAVELARTYGDGFRVNAIAPGFFIGDQNRALLLEADGTLTARGRTIIEHTPMGRFGDPDELVGTLVWLCSDASRFVTGAVIPVDGGFSAFSGV